MADRQSIRQIWLEMKAAADRDGLTFFGGCSMAKSATVGLSYGALRKECLEAVRQWPGCDTISGIQIIRDNTRAGFSARVTCTVRPISNRRSSDPVRPARKATAFLSDRMILRLKSDTNPVGQGRPRGNECWWPLVDSVEAAQCPNNARFTKARTATDGFYVATMTAASSSCTKPMFHPAERRP